MPDPSFGISQLIKRVAEKQKAAVTPQIVSNKLHLLCKCALLYDAVVFVPVQAVWDEVERGVLAPVNLDCPDFEHRDLSISVRRGRTLPHAAVLLRSLPPPSSTHGRPRIVRSWSVHVQSGGMLKLERVRPV